MSDEELFLSVKNLEVQYTSGGSVIHAVNGVSFGLKKGETLGLVGETGAGKTTIAQSILRILPEPPAQINNGEIFYEGRDLLKISENDMRKIRGRHISMVFQDPMTALNPTMKIGEQIMDGYMNHNHCSKREARQVAVDMLGMVGITEDRFNEYPHQFSGGMKQRVVIAIALACDPDLLLADEPTTALDVTVQAQVLHLIKGLREQKAMSMILITHDLGIVAENCDNVAIVYAGEIVEYGNKEEIFDNPSHPYTLGLFGSLPNMNSDAERLKPIKGQPSDPSNLPEGCHFHPRCPYATDACKHEPIKTVNLEGTHQCKCCNVATVQKMRDAGEEPEES